MTLERSPVGLPPNDEMGKAWNHLDPGDDGDVVGLRPGAVLSAFLRDAELPWHTDTSRWPPFDQVCARARSFEGLWTGTSVRRWRGRPRAVYQSSLSRTQCTGTPRRSAHERSTGAGLPEGASAATKGGAPELFWLPFALRAFFRLRFGLEPWHEDVVSERIAGTRSTTGRPEVG